MTSAVKTNAKKKEQDKPQSSGLGLDGLALDRLLRPIVELDAVLEAVRAAL